MKHYDSTSKESVAELAQDIARVPTSKAPWFAAELMTTGLMTTNPIIHVGVSLGTLFHRDSPYTRWRILFERRPQLATDLIRDAAKHARSGKDAYDPRSAGGFSSGEVRTLEGILERFLATGTNVPVRGLEKTSG